MTFTWRRIKKKEEITKRRFGRRERWLFSLVGFWFTLSLLPTHRLHLYKTHTSPFMSFAPIQSPRIPLLFLIIVKACCHERKGYGGANKQCPLWYAWCMSTIHSLFFLSAKKSLPPHDRTGFLFMSNPTLDTTTIINPFSLEVAFLIPLSSCCLIITPTNPSLSHTVTDHPLSLHQWINLCKHFGLVCCWWLDYTFACLSMNDSYYYEHLFKGQSFLSCGFTR